MTLKLCSTVRSKNLINYLYFLGICLSYDRLLDITKNISDYCLTYDRLLDITKNISDYCLTYDRLLDITKNISDYCLRQYEHDKVFLPKQLKKNVYTVIPKDNIDLNATSTTSTWHYHSTSMSVLQFPTDENPRSVQDFYHQSIHK